MMMRTIQFLILGLVVGLMSNSILGQVLTATSNADLRLEVDDHEGNPVVIETKALAVGYEPGPVMKGELDLSALNSGDARADNLIDSMDAKIVRFESRLPGNELLYGEAMNQQFTSETRIWIGDKEAMVIFTFEANRKNVKSQRTYQVSTRGVIDLVNDFGITEDIGIRKQIRFQFYQTIQVKKF